MKAEDPLLKFAEYLKGKAILTDESETEMEVKAKGEIDLAVATANEAPFPDIAEATYPVYAEEIPHG
jgi:TPP-dependent pyruvate/acetoin dehydrogenase alpha subunit